MRLIDADELNEYIGRESLDTREKIFNLVERQPTIETIYGYPLEDLILFACACREQYITKEELHNFVVNALAGYQFGYNDFVKAYTKTMDEIFGKHDFKFGREEKE